MATIAQSRHRRSELLGVAFRLDDRDRRPRFVWFSKSGLHALANVYEPRSRRSVGVVIGGQYVGHSLRANRVYQIHRSELVSRP
jgi:hypothetical protein